MIVIFAKSQLPLFDAPVHVSGSIRKDGTVVKPHVRIQKVSAKRKPAQAALFSDLEPAQKPKKRSKLDAWIEKKGGLRALARVLSTMTEGQQQRIFAEMARLDGKTPAEVAAMFDGLALKEPEKGETADLFSQPAPAPDELEPKPATAPERPPAGAAKLSVRARRALEVLREGGYFRKQLERSFKGGERFKTRLRDASGNVVPGVGFQTREELSAAGMLVRRPVQRSSVWPEEWGLNPERAQREVAESSQGKGAPRRRGAGTPIVDRDAPKGRDRSRASRGKRSAGEAGTEVVLKRPMIVYHGTAHGVTFDRFDPSRANTGVGGNALDQGDHFYVTRSRRAAEWFAKRAEENRQLRSGALTPDLRPGNVLEFELPAGTRILHVDHMPRMGRGQSLIEAARSNGYDAIEFPDRGFETVEGDPDVGALVAEEGLPATLIVLNTDALSASSSSPQKAQRDRAAPFGVKAGISKAKRREINAEVIARLERGGPYGEADRALLSQYSGNGGCGDSLNEYYTDPEVARGMWSVLQRLGFEHGTALEPSCGAGVFLHTAPAGVRVTGIELDPISSKVALALHSDRHEIHTASLERFATTDDRQFDVVIGNPPYGPRGFIAKDDKTELTTAEQYFVDTALDKCKPGGLVALVVPTGIMDSKSARSFRERMLRKGEFLGAQRMPNTAFEHSHTEVTTDVIYLRKRPDDVAGALSTVGQEMLQKLGVWDEEFLAGTYFTGRGAGNVLGTMTEGWRAKAGIGNDITVEGSMAGVPQAIADFAPHSESAAATALTVQDVLHALGNDETAKDRAVSAALRRPYANTAKLGDTKTIDGVTYVLQGDPPRWHRVDEFMQNEAVTQASELAAEIDRLFGGEPVDRPALEAKVRAYVEKHGIPANNPNLMVAASVDRMLYRLIGAVNPQGEISDAVAGRSPRKVAGTFDTIAQSLALETESGDFTAAELAERLGRSVEDVEEQLIADSRYAYVDAGRWTTMGAYLTGELWPKLDIVRAALAGEVPEGVRDKLKMQAERLEKAIDPKSLEDVDIQINSAFLPLKVLDAYFNWRQYESEHANEWTKKNQPVAISFEKGVYKVRGGNVWGDTKLLDKYLNRTGVKKDDASKIDQWNGEFKDWLCSSQYRDEVEDLYNRKFRGFVAREYSDEPIEVPGLATDRDVRAWRWSSLRRSLAMGKGIVADDVGLGKTLGGLLLARMAKIQGKAQKPIIVVPKSVLANWYSETQTWFPGSRVLTIGANFSQNKDGNLVGRDDKASERKRKYHDLTQNDYDFILISEPAFQEVDLDPELKERYYSDDFWVQRGEALGNAGDKRRKRIKEQFEQALAAREFKERTDAIYFNELGVDMLIADEMHHQKNLYAARARFGQQPKFLGGQGLSNRALDFNLKTRWLRERNGGNGVYGLTATPTSNSPLEIYSMLAHIVPEAFERIGIRNSEEFLDRFCEFQNDKILSTAGDIEDALVVAGFKNLDELREIMARFIDRRTAEMVGLKLPERDERMHLVEMTPKQQGVYAELREMAELASGKDATGDAHIFSIMDKMTKAALDLELLDPEAYKGASSPKYAELAKHVKGGLKEGAQIVFSEFIDSHDKIVAALVDAGVPRDRIGVINAKVAGSAVKRQNIADALNSGKLDVVIGNATMSEGLNMQKRTTDIHHLDIPWTPAAIQQRNGRGLRQGNLNEAVRIHSYLSKGSFDGYRYQSVGAKKDWQDLLWNGGDRVENLAREGNVSREEMRIMLAADPEEARQKFEEDKAAAQQRYDAGQRAEANAAFVRFQDMKRSYTGLKNKSTVSAQRLRQRIEAARIALFNNKHFLAKQALDSDTDVLIEPQTGLPLQAGVGINVDGEDKMVVTGVNMRAGTVTLRRYAGTGGARPVTVPLSELGSGVKRFEFSEAEEAAEVGRKLEAEAADKVNHLKSWDDVKQLPSAVLEANHDAIQRQIKEGTKAYTFHMPYGGVPMVDRKTGELKVAESYEHGRMHDTHDYLLPTDANKERVIQAWMESERGKRFGKESFQRRRGGRVEWRNRVEYPDAPYSSKGRNPWTAVLHELGGDKRSGRTVLAGSGLEAKARERFEREQLERVRRAPTFKDALKEAFPLATMPEYGGDERTQPVWNRRALAALWARARREGALDSPFEEHLPQQKAEFSDRVHSRHDRYSYYRPGYAGEDKTVHGTLRDIARGSGHEDLATAIAVSGVRHGVEKAEDALSRLDRLGRQEGASGHYQTGRGRVRYPPGVLPTMLKVAEQAGIADKTVRDVGVSSWGVLSSGGQASHKTVRQAITDAMTAEKEGASA